MFRCSNSGETYTYDLFKPCGVAYKDDVMTPIFLWRKTAYTARETVCLLLGDYDAEYLCISQPINVSNNVSFLLDTSCFNHPYDLKCDDMGSWKHNGSLKRWFHVQTDLCGDIIINC